MTKHQRTQQPEGRCSLPRCLLTDSGNMIQKIGRGGFDKKQIKVKTRFPGSEHLI